MHFILHYTQHFGKKKKVVGVANCINCFSETYEHYFSIHQLYNLLYTLSKTQQ